MARAGGPGGLAPSCLNCGAELSGPYCASCGQERPHTDLTLREFLRETTEELTHWNGRVPATLRALLLEPGRVTSDFLAGRRVRWLPPLRLYLICSLAFFFSTSLNERITHRTSRALSEITVTNPDGTLSLTPAGREQIGASLPARIFGRDRMERAAVNNREFSRAVDSAYPKALFLLLPVFALLTNLAWRDRFPRYPLHLYTALHLHSAAFAVLAVAALMTVLFRSDEAAIVINAAVFAYLVWYGLVAMRRVFGASWPETILKGAAIAVVYACCLFATSLTMFAYALWRV